MPRVSCRPQVYFGTQLSRIYLLSVLLKQNCLCGASLLMSKHSLGEAGGEEFHKIYIYTCVH